MAYVPPHKRLSNSQEGPPLTPAKLASKFEKNFNLHSSKSRFKRTGQSTSYRNRIVYANDSISKWLVVPLMDEEQLSSVRLVPVSVEAMEKKSGGKPLTLVKVKSPSLEECHDNTSCVMEHAWASVVETVHTDLLSAIQNASKEMEDHTVEEIKAAVVARFGKVLFRLDPTSTKDCVQNNPVSETYVRNLKRSFYTNVPKEYMDHVKTAILPELGFHFVSEKESYLVKLTDAKQPKTTIACKCRVLNDEKKLELSKIEVERVRHMVVDISCLESDVDLRLALCTKKFSTLQDEEETIIKDLINSAIFDPNVKGGLKWPLGKANSGGQYSITGVWHTKAISYGNSLMRLKMREADRYDFLTSTGEVQMEISLKLFGITRNLLEQGSDVVGCSTMLEDVVDLIKNNFLAWKGNLVPYSES